MMRNLKRLRELLREKKIEIEIEVEVEVEKAKAVAFQTAETQSHGAHGGIEGKNPIHEGHKGKRRQRNIDYK